MHSNGTPPMPGRQSMGPGSGYARWSVSSQWLPISPWSAISNIETCVWIVPSCCAPRWDTRPDLRAAEAGRLKARADQALARANAWWDVSPQLEYQRDTYLPKA